MKVKIDGIFEREIKSLPKARDYFKKSEDLFYESFLSFVSILDSLSSDKGKDFFNRSVVDSITLLHKSCEIMLAGIIFRENPMLLIQKDDFFESTEPLNFDDCITVNTDKLLSIAKTIEKKHESNLFSIPFKGKVFQEIFKKNRKIRNKETHGVMEIKDLDYQEVLLDFLSIYFIFHKKENFLKDLYKELVRSEIESDYFYFGSIKERNKETQEMFENLGISEKEIPKPFYNGRSIVAKKQTIQFFLGCIISIENYMSKADFEILVENKIKYNRYICPNCENSYRTYHGEERHKFEYCPSNTLYQEEQLPPSIKSLIEIEKKRFSRCFICGFEVHLEDVEEKICKCCQKSKNKKNSFFVRCREKDRNKIHKNCLNCGCSELDIENDFPD